LSSLELREVARVPGGGAEVPLARDGPQVRCRRRSGEGPGGGTRRGRRDVRGELNRAPESGGVNWTALKPLSNGKSRPAATRGSRRTPSRDRHSRRGMTTTSSFRSTSLTLAIPFVSSLRTPVVLIAASLGGVRGDRRAVTALSHQADTLVCVLLVPAGRVARHVAGVATLDGPGGARSGPRSTRPCHLRSQLRGRSGPVR
jgi:hypothetical protein